MRFASLLDWTDSYWRVDNVCGNADIIGTCDELAAYISANAGIYG